MIHLTIRPRVLAGIGIARAAPTAAGLGTGNTAADPLAPFDPNDFAAFGVRS